MRKNAKLDMEVVVYMAIIIAVLIMAFYAVFRWNLFGIADSLPNLGSPGGDEVVVSFLDDSCLNEIGEIKYIKKDGTYKEGLDALVNGEDYNIFLNGEDSGLIINLYTNVDKDWFISREVSGINPWYGTINKNTGKISINQAYLTPSSGNDEIGNEIRENLILLNGKYLRKVNGFKICDNEEDVEIPLSVKCENIIGKIETGMDNTLFIYYKRGEEFERLNLVPYIWNPNGKSFSGYINLGRLKGFFINIFSKNIEVAKVSNNIFVVNSEYFDEETNLKYAKNGMPSIEDLEVLNGAEFFINDNKIYLCKGDVKNEV
jgi:hypothetical protein